MKAITIGLMLLLCVTLSACERGGDALSLMTQSYLLKEEKLADGTRCAVAKSDTSVSVDCDWMEYNLFKQGIAEDNNNDNR